jgi:Kef-type K+ transport system membrane component KefB
MIAFKNPIYWACLYFSQVSVIIFSKVINLKSGNVVRNFWLLYSKSWLAVCAVSLVIRLFLPVIFVRNHSTRHAIADKNGVVFISGRYTRSASATRLKKFW